MRQVLRRPAATKDIAEPWECLAEQDLDAADRGLDRLDAALQTWARLAPASASRSPSIKGYDGLSEPWF